LSQLSFKLHDFINIGAEVKNKILLLILSLTTLSLSSDPKFYGKLWISVESEDTLADTEIGIVSNASRLGLKGSIGFGAGLEAIYQIEYEVDPVDGVADESKGRTFKQRNSFIGLKGSYGTLFLGTHDTALKKSQSKIDLFNDLAGDIKNILQGENRMSDFIGYTTTTFAGGLSITLNAIKDTERLVDNSIGSPTSMALNYKTENLYASIAVDSEIKGYDNTRITFQIPHKKNTLGFIYQETENKKTGVEEDGYVLSFSRKIGDSGTFSIQTAKSDMKIGSGEQNSIGYHHKLTSKTELFFFYTDLSGEKASKEKEIVAIGFEYNF
jgi:predicted porin